MKNSLKLLGAGVCLAAMATSNVSAALVTFTYPGGGNGTSPLPVSVTNSSGVTGGTDLGADLGGDSNGFVAGWQVHANLSNDSFPPDLASAQMDASYFELTLTPNAGESLDLTNLDLSSTTFFYQLTGPTYFTVEESTDGFTTAPTTLMTYATTATSFSVAGTDLTLTGLSDVAAPVEFRIYTYGEPGNYFLASVQGSTAVVGSVIPEPSTYALLLVSGIALAGFGRRLARSN